MSPSTNPYDIPVAQRQRKTYERLLKVWQPYRDAMDQEEAWLDGERYQVDDGAYNRDRRRIQIRGQETQDTTRHIVAKCTERERLVTPRPTDRDSDPDEGEAVAALVRWELENPQKGFDREVYAALTDACEKRAGCVWMDWDVDQLPFGELCYSRTDFRRLMYSPEWHPHHYKCDILVREKRLHVDQARETYGKDWLEPDKGFRTRGGTLRPGVPLIQGTTGNYLGVGQSYDDDCTTIWEFWWKNDRTPKDKPKKGQDLGLAPKDRYLLCLGIPGQTEGCGYRSPTQAQLSSMGKPQTLPPYLEQACPQCQGDLERVDAKALDAYERAYKNGRRLVVLAPFSPAPDDEPVADGGWPIPTLRSFPGLFFFRYVKGGRPMGPSDTALMWDQQAASDNLRTMAAQRVFEHRAYYVLPRKGAFDYRNRAFTFREDQFNHIYMDREYGPNAIQMVQGSGLDPQFSVAFNICQQALTQYRPGADLGPVEDRQNKSGVALQTEAAIGEVPVADFQRRCNGEYGMFYGNVWDGLRYTLTPEKAARLKIDGIDLVMNLLGDDLPGYDFSIENMPEFSGLVESKDKYFQGMMNAYQQAIQLQLNPQLAVEAYAEINNAPRSVLKKFEQMISDQEQTAFQQLQQLKAQMAGPMGPPGGGPGNAPLPSGPPPPQMQGAMA
jgi:hypothetical protein